MTIVWLPFVYAVLGRPDRRYKPRWTWMADQLVADVEDATAMPSPVITADLEWGGRLEWHEKNGQLLRAIAIEDRAATLSEIGNALDLIQPRLPAEWFFDHPGAVRPLWCRDDDEDNEWRHAVKERLVVVRSDREHRAQARQEMLDRSLVCGDSLFWPASPPTWRVGLYDGHHVTVTLAAFRPHGLDRIGFHFPLHRKDAALAFAKEMGDGREVIGDGSEHWAAPGQEFGDGAEATTRSLAPTLLRMAVDAPMLHLPGDILPMLGFFKAVMDDGLEAGAALPSTDVGQVTPDDLLRTLERTDLGELLPESVELRRCLLARRRHLDEANAPELHELRL